MAFNLEFKITYDELSPSLQDMFKSLQGQITDNRNEITNINMDITDISNEITEINNEINTINNHLTQIDNSIININENIQNIENDITQIEGDITDLGDQITEINNNITIINDKLEEVDPDTISNLDFLNLAPKIGYYQDDTVEVISKYNMNFIFDESNNVVSKKFVITEDNLNREIIYVVANDGSYTITNRLYYGYRTDHNQSFVWVNTPLETPKCLESIGDLTYVDCVSCDNEWIMLLVKYGGSTHLLLIDTHNTTDTSQWDNYKDISNLYRDSNNIRYIKKYGTIVSVKHNNFKNNATNCLTFYVYRYSDLSLLQEVKFPGANELVYSPSRYVKTSSGGTSHRLKDDNEDHTFGYVTAPVTLFYENLGKMMFVGDRLTVTWYNSSNSLVNDNTIVVKCDYDISTSLFKGQSGTIKLLNPVWEDYNEYYYNTDRFKYNADHGSVHLCVSYSAKNDYYYLCGETYTQVSNTVQRLKGSKQKYTTYDKYTSLYIRDYKDPWWKTCTPDASNFGKGIRAMIGAGNYIFLEGISRGEPNEYSKEFSISKFQIWEGHNSSDNCIVEPSPGSIVSAAITDYTGGTRYATSVKNSDSTISYFHAWSHHSSDKYIYDIIPFSVINQNGRIEMRKTSNISTISITKSKIQSALGSNISYMDNRCMTNGKVIFFPYSIRTPGSNQQKFRFCVITGNETVVTYSNWSNLCSNITVFDSYSNYLSSGTFNPTIGIVYNNGLTFVLNWEYYRYNNSYISRSFGIKFSSDYKSFTTFNYNTRHNVYSNSYLVTRPIPTVYSTKYGAVGIGNGWTYRPERIVTQKPLIGGLSWEKSYSDTEFFENSKANVYYMYLQSSSGLVCYVPTTNIFLGGYYTVIENPIEVTLQANADNYIYLERGEDRDTINAYSTTSQLFYEGERLFSTICIAKCTTDSQRTTSVTYYRINIGYNDYVWNGGGR